MKGFTLPGPAEQVAESWVFRQPLLAPDLIVSTPKQGYWGARPQVPPQAQSALAKVPTD